MRRRDFDVVFYMPTVAALLRPDTAMATGGAETQIFLLSRLIARRGLRVGLIAYDLPGGLPSEIDGVTIIVRPPHRANKPMSGRIAEAARIWRILHSARASVLVTRTMCVEVGLIGIFARLTRARYAHSAANVVDFAPSDLPPFDKAWNRGLYELGLRLADVVVVQTEEQVPLLERGFGRTATLIKSIAEGAPATNGEPTAFLWVGRVTDYKRPMAFLELARSLPDARFLMLAVPEDSNQDFLDLRIRVEQAAAELPNLELLEPRARETLRPLIDQAVAMVNTSDFEGMPNVLLEGWARGIPALVLNHDPSGVVEREGLGAFAGGSTERFQSLAAAMWDDRGGADRRRLSLLCRAYVQREHSPEAVAGRWVDLLTGLSARRP